MLFALLGAYSVIYMGVEAYLKSDWRAKWRR